MVTPASPYVGLRPFEEQDVPQFCGRDREARNLVSYIYANNLVLFYAASGAGKSSLLNAAVIPQLREDFEVFPPARISVPFASATRAGTGNSFIENVLGCWAAADQSVLGPRPPERVDISLSDFLALCPRPTNSSGDPMPRLIILDQFEEFFANASSNALRERQDFWRQLCEALENDRSLRVVVALREEFVAALDPYLLLLHRRSANFHLERLNRSAALEAIQRPLKETGVRLTDAAAAKLVEGLCEVRFITPEGQLQTAMGEFVEPAQLQVVCENLWKELPEDAQEITEQDLATFGNVNDALIKLVDDAIAQAFTQTSISEEKLRSWVESQLITPAGTRGLVLKGIDQTGGIPNAAVEILARFHLLRAELRAGATWYELANDRLIEPVQHSNERWSAKRS